MSDEAGRRGGGMNEMNVEIDYLIDTCEKQLKLLEGSGKVELGIVLLCALQLFKCEKQNEERGANV